MTWVQIPSPTCTSHVTFIELLTPFSVPQLTHLQSGNKNSTSLCWAGNEMRLQTAQHRPDLAQETTAASLVGSDAAAVLDSISCSLPHTSMRLLGSAGNGRLSVGTSCLIEVPGVRG